MPNSTGDSNKQSDIDRMREQHELFDHEMRVGRSFSGQERNCAFLNLGQLSFANVSSITGLDYLEDGRGLALSDWDLDGDVDFLLTNRNAPMFRFLRNDIQSGNHFVSFKLAGTLCNRDAIGARIRVKIKDGDWLTKTVVAGSGFLSQSSKRITFGLGQADQIEMVEIDWPDGSQSNLANLAMDQHYSIEQTDEAPLVKTLVRPEQTDLQAGPLAFPSRTAVATYVVPPIRMPITEMKNHDGTLSRIDLATANDATQFTLLNLWASWCEPCKVELKEFSENYNQFTELGIRVIALTTDGLPNQDTTLEDAKWVADKLKFPFEWGTADQDWIEKMSILRGAFYDVQQPYPIPTSFLIDSAGQLRVVYQGKVGLEQLRQDIQRLASPQDELRNLITPFSQSWTSKPRTANDLRLKSLFADQGYPADAAFYDGHAGPEKARLEYANAVKSIMANDFNSANGSLLAAIKYDPTYAPAHLNLADIISKAAQQTRGPNAVQYFKLAEHHYRQAVKYEPDNFDANFGLGFVLARQGQVDKAIGWFDVASKLAPLKWESQLAAAKLLASQGKLAPAIQRLQTAVSQSPDDETLVVELSGLLIHSGRYDESKDLCDAFLKKRSNPLIQTRLADTYFFAGQPEEAVSLYQQVQPSPLLALKTMWIYSTSSDPALQKQDTLRPFVNNMLQSNRANDPLSRQVVAAALAQLGDFEMASRIQMSALRLYRPGTADAQAAQKRLTDYQNKKPARQKGAQDNPFAQSLLQTPM